MEVSFTPPYLCNLDSGFNTFPTKCIIIDIFKNKINSTKIHFLISDDYME